MKLIAEWKQSYLYWSQRFQLLCAAIAGWFVFDPNSMLWVWNSMPHAVRVMMPASLSKTVSIILFAMALCGAAARVVRQPKAQAKIEAKKASHDLAA